MRSRAASAQAAEKLEQAGYTNVYDDEEGMAGWREAQNLVATSRAVAVRQP